MAANGALAKDDHGASENVGTLNGNRNGYGLIKLVQIIVRPLHNAFAAMDVHGIVHGQAVTLG